jgi:hypothetical protein
MIYWIILINLFLLIPQLLIFNILSFLTLNFININFNRILLIHLINFIILFLIRQRILIHFD